MRIRFSAAIQQPERKTASEEMTWRPSRNLQEWFDWSFSRGGFLIIQCGMHRVPRQRGAFHANRKLAHAREYLEVAEIIRRGVFIQFAGHHAMKLAEEFLRLLLAFSLHCLSHHAGSGFRDRAPGAFKANFLDGVVFQIQIDGQLIAAEWIEALGRVVGRLQLAKVPRLLIVIENDLLVEFA
jgi:hypothetical protein